MIKVKSDNIQVMKYTKDGYKASIVKLDKERREKNITIVCGIFNLKELEQWREVIKAYDRDFKPKVRF